jgi:hypothetical protein
MGRSWWGSCVLVGVVSGREEWVRLWAAKGSGELGPMKTIWLASSTTHPPFPSRISVDYENLSLSGS